MKDMKDNISGVGANEFQHQNFREPSGANLYYGKSTEATNITSIWMVILGHLLSHY